MKEKKLSILALKSQSHLLTFLLSIILFWIGLGVGDNMSDFRFWIQSTWTTIKLEWIFILLYITLSRRFLLLGDMWKKHRFTALISILWLTIVLLSYLLSPYYSWQNPLAYMRLTETVTHFLFFLILWDFFSHHDVDHRMIFMAIIISALVVLSYFIYIHFAFPDLKADKHVFSMRSNELILNTHLHRIGYHVETAILLTIAFLFSKKYKYIAIISLGILSVFLLWLGGRAAMLGILVALLVLFFFFRKNISIKAFLITGTLITLSTSLVLYLDLLNLDYIMHAIQKTFQANSLDRLFSGRIELWSLGLEKLEGYWWLGTGPQSYFFYSGRVGEVIHAHNFILQFLGEWGILGSVLFLFLLYRALSLGITLHSHLPSPIRIYHLSAGLTIIALFTTSLFSGVLFFHQTEIYLTVMLAIWVSPLKQKCINNKKR